MDSTHKIMIATASTTIAALATAVGYSGVAIIRLSGSQSIAIIQQLTKKPKKTFSPRTAVYCHFYDEQQQILDSGLVLYFPQPHSFTGEDVVEIQCHGSPVIIEQLLNRLFQLGAVAASAGEFSERAFLNNKIDLTQAEAIMDLIHAKSIQAARVAQNTLQGTFSDYLDTTCDHFLHLRSALELALDFPDEEVDFIDKSAIQKQIQNLKQQIQQLINTAYQGKQLTEEITTVIIGKPNVGKSTLMNRLLQNDRAIVSNQPGTTRDLIEDTFNLEGLTIRLIDTAGIRPTTDTIEQEGIRRAHKAIQQAHLILLLIDSADTLPLNIQQATEILEDIPNLETQQIPIIITHTRSDLQKTPTANPKNYDLSNLPIKPFATLSISAKFGDGMDELLQTIKRALRFQPSEAKFSARSRHLHALKQTVTYLDEALLNLPLEPELTAESIKLAHDCLQQITGKVYSDDILGNIFQNFCIGK